VRVRVAVRTCAHVRAARADRCASARLHSARMRAPRGARPGVFVIEVSFIIS